MIPTLREDAAAGDAAVVREIVASTGFFSAEELEVAAWQVGERLARGPESGYSFLFAEASGEPLGYACYGRILGTRESFDLYWIAVRGERRGQGAGRLLLAAVEQRVAAANGRRLYAETSSRPLYAPTRRFYERAGYRREAELADYYAPGEGKVVYLRLLGPPAG